MGNICLQNQENQKPKIIKINGYPSLNYPNKQLLEPSIQNLSLNLDTFEEDFFKTEFILEISSDGKRNQSTRKVKLGSTLEEINRLNLIKCPSLGHFEENFEIHQDNQFKFIHNLHKNDKNFIPQDQKQNKQKKKNRKVLLQKLVKPKSILKNNKSQNASNGSFHEEKSQRTVTFSIASSKSKNSRSLSPMIMPLSANKQQVNSRSMSQLLQFPYL